MKRKPLFVKMWIRIKDKLPPATEEDILVFNHHTKRIYIWTSCLARLHAQTELGKDAFHKPHALSYDRHISHWMPIWTVDGSISSDFEKIRQKAIKAGHEARKKAEEKRTATARATRLAEESRLALGGPKQRRVVRRKG